MSLTSIQEPPAPAEVVAPAARGHRVRRRSRGLMIGLALVVLVIVLAIFGSAISGYGPNTIDGRAILADPSSAHWLGTDDFGRDLFSRVCASYRISLAVALGSVFMALALGVPLGLAAGYFGSKVDGLIMRPLDVLMAFPVVLLAVTITAIAGAGTGILIIAIGVVYTPIIARTMRAAALATTSQTYIEAVRARGASSWRILTRHVLPNSAGPVIVQASLLGGLAIILEAALSFVGLGVQPPTASLGLMLSDGRDFMATSPWVVAAPGVALVILVLAFTLIGEALARWLDPRSRARVR
jgi:peptide/nickel transport system permease protein